ncbi:MAG: hypothetical protein PWQ57_1350 [Desulfovibrionales bacterium]|jgi:quercetin dioxygenase-like cupin family protein|nr:hypothetical protein [Desulfovibrionales bacterium]
MKSIHYTDIAPHQLKVAGPGSSIRVLIGKADGAANFCMRVVELAPGAEIPSHQHPWEHEQFIHSGTGEAVIGGERIRMVPGGAVFVPSDVEHQVSNTGTEPLVFVCLVPNFAPEM